MPLGRVAEDLELFRSAPESVDWAYGSPAPQILPGERTGRYTLAGDQPAGAEIPAEDFAVTLIDEIERPAHRRTRLTGAAG